MTDTVQEVRQAGSRSDEQKVSGVELHMALIQHMADIAHMVDTQHMAHIAGTVGMAHGVHRGTKGARTDRKPGHTGKILSILVNTEYLHDLVSLLKDLFSLGPISVGSKFFHTKSKLAFF